MKRVPSGKRAEVVDKNTNEATEKKKKTHSPVVSQSS